ncbi:MAG: hypothetical protein ACJ72D_24965 [Marmoricola sp.]
MTAPPHLPLFFVQQRARRGTIVHEIRSAAPSGMPGDVIASASAVRKQPVTRLAFYGDDADTPVFSVTRREPSGSKVEFDVFDERAEAIGYVSVEPGASRGDVAFHISAPYLEADGRRAGGRVAGWVEFLDLGAHPGVDLEVLKIVPRFGQYRAVGVSDKRLAFRLAAAAAVAIEVAG